MANPILEVRNLHKMYDNGVYALKGVSFRVFPGEFLAIIGLSGSGKSTLLRCLNGLIRPSGGEIFFQNEEITHLSPKEWRGQRRHIGMIFQHFNLIPRKSVLTNALSGKLGSTPTLQSVLGKFSEEDQNQAMAYLDLVGLREKADIRADELSGGQQQRVAIARALMQNPQVLLADEPVASLDPATSHSIMDYLKQVNGMGKTVLCNLHFLSLVRQYATRAIALKAGEIVFEGDPKSISDDWFQKIYGDGASEVQIR